MELILGAFAVLFIVIVVEASPILLTSVNELVLIVLASAGTTALLFNKFDRRVCAFALAIAGFALGLRVLYRLVRALADDQEIVALLRARRR